MVRVITPIGAGEFREPTFLPQNCGLQLKVKYDTNIVDNIITVFTTINSLLALFYAIEEKGKGETELEIKYSWENLPSKCLFKPVKEFINKHP